MVPRGAQNAFGVPAPWRSADYSLYVRYNSFALMPDLHLFRLGTILVAIGDGLVIPKMKEFGLRFPGSLDSTWLKLEGLKTACFICH